MAEVKTWVGFGDWIAFKVADILERLGLVQVIFPEGAAFLFDSPRDAADLVAELEGGDELDGYSLASKRAWAIGSVIARVNEYGRGVYERKEPRAQSRLKRSLRQSDRGDARYPLPSGQNASKRMLEGSKSDGILSTGEKDTTIRLCSSGVLAPPRYERTINVQEAETALCKYGSYYKGHYEVGEDIQSARDGLLRFGRCKLAQELIRAGRKGGLWK